MISIFSTLKEKLEDTEYIDSLSYRKKAELAVCKEMLSDEELEQYCSISSAYKVARKRYIIEHYGPDALDTAIFVRYNDVL